LSLNKSIANILYTPLVLSANQQGSLHALQIVAGGGGLSSTDIPRLFLIAYRHVLMEPQVEGSCDIS